MIEMLPAFVAGGAVVAGVPLLRRVLRKALPDSAWESLPELFRGEHDHDPHINGTTVIGGVKHKRMYCVKCQKRWVEPC